MSCKPRVSSIRPGSARAHSLAGRTGKARTGASHLRRVSAVPVPQWRSGCRRHDQGPTAHELEHAEARRLAGSGRAWWFRCKISMEACQASSFVEFQACSPQPCSHHVPNPRRRCSAARGFRSSRKHVAPPVQPLSGCDELRQIAPPMAVGVEEGSPRANARCLLCPSPGFPVAHGVPGAEFRISPSSATAPRRPYRPHHSPRSRHRHRH
mmetsp:Transcript_75123/g.165907  ORF Transcript_75123/g.165907 Transcript_75123/m.165907 type:complete len:210 (+) Transcript_75123:525-1154(+)